MPQLLMSLARVAHIQLLERTNLQSTQGSQTHLATLARGLRVLKALSAMRPASHCRQLEKFARFDTPDLRQVRADYLIRLLRKLELASS